MRGDTTLNRSLGKVYGLTRLERQILYKVYLRSPQPDLCGGLVRRNPIKPHTSESLLAGWEVGSRPTAEVLAGALDRLIRAGWITIVNLYPDWPWGDHWNDPCEFVIKTDGPRRHSLAAMGLLPGA